MDFSIKTDICYLTLNETAAINEKQIYTCSPKLFVLNTVLCIIWAVRYSFFIAEEAWSWFDATLVKHWLQDVAARRWLHSWMEKPSAQSFNNSIFCLCSRRCLQHFHVENTKHEMPSVLALWLVHNFKTCFHDEYTVHNGREKWWCKKQARNVIDGTLRAWLFSDRGLWNQSKDNWAKAELIQHSDSLTYICQSTFNECLFIDLRLNQC